MRSAPIVSDLEVTAGQEPSADSMSQDDGSLSELVRRIEDSSNIPIPILGDVPGGLLGGGGGEEAVRESQRR